MPCSLPRPRRRARAPPRPAAAAQPRAEASPRPDASGRSERDGHAGGRPGEGQGREAAREKEEPPVVTRHELRLGGRTLKYTVTTGLMPLKNEAGETEASIFFMAYVAERPADPRSGR